MAVSDPSKPATLALCAKCGVEKPLTAFHGRLKTCSDCRGATKARTMERKEAISFTPALAEKIVDLISMGSTITEVAAMSGMPTARQMASWRRAHPEFRDAYEEARVSRADARSDRVDAALRDLAAGKITAADCRVMVETELKLAAKENPGRYGDATQIDLTTAGKPLQVDVGAALKALLDVLPASNGALPAPEPLEVDATPVPSGMLQ